MRKGTWILLVSRNDRHRVLLIVHQQEKEEEFPEKINKLKITTCLYGSRKLLSGVLLKNQFK